MDAFVSFLQTPWAIVIALAIAVVIGVVIRLVVSSRRSSNEVTSAPREQVPASGDVAAPPEAEDEATDQPRDGSAAEESPTGDAEPSPDKAAPALVERPESVGGRMERLRSRLASSGALGRAILGVLSRGKLSAADWEEIEESLLVADLGLEATDSLMEALKRRVAVESTTDEVRVRQR